MAWQLVLILRSGLDGPHNGVVGWFQHTGCKTLAFYLLFAYKHQVI
jgi:hypothetical protein